jgi:hypothetical protein
VRCPRHTIQFLSYGYSEYIKVILELLELDISNLEWQKYESWTPYPPADRQD